jgi:hypothetical protein
VVEEQEEWWKVEEEGAGEERLRFKEGVAEGEMADILTRLMGLRRARRRDVSLSAQCDVLEIVACNDFTTSPMFHWHCTTRMVDGRGDGLGYGRGCICSAPRFTLCLRARVYDDTRR